MEVWNVLHVARWKYRTQKVAKNSPSAHHRTTLSGHIFTTKACIDNRKKLVKQQYLLHMSSQYGGLQPTNGSDQFVSLGHPSKFQQVSHLGGITAPTSLIEANQTLHDVCCLLSWYTIYTFSGALAPWRNSAHCKIHLASKSCALLYWQS